MSYIKDVGTRARHITGGAASETITLSASPSPGNTLILLGAFSNVTGVGTTATDSKGNTWLLAKGNGAGIWSTVQLVCQQDVAALVAGDTITVTFAASGVFNTAFIVQEHSGLLSPVSSIVDKSATNFTSTASTTRPAATTATTTQAADLIISNWGINQVETSFTPPSGWSVGDNPFITVSVNGTGALEAMFAYVSATGAYGTTATGGVSSQAGVTTVAYKQSSGGTTKSIAGTITANSTVSGNVIAKHRITPTSGITAQSSVSGGLGGVGGGGGTTPAAGFGISEFGVGSFGEEPTTGGSGGGGSGGGGGTGGGGGGGTTSTPNQPTIVPPTTPTGDAIIDFIESSPPGVFPENDDSNFGFAIRGLWCNKVEDLIAQQDLLYKERFVTTSDVFLDEWEKMTGTPESPAGFDLTTRRAIVLGRLRKGPFTRAKRKEIIERYLKATFGGGIAFGPSGMQIGSGIKLTGGSTAPDVSTVYKVVENIAGFSYTVYILNTYTPAAGLQRELARITPAGISFTISYVATLP